MGDKWQMELRSLLNKHKQIVIRFMFYRLVNRMKEKNMKEKIWLRVFGAFLLYFTTFLSFLLVLVVVVRYEVKRTELM